MYDFQIIVPCIKERLEVFQKIGFSNIGDTKILVYCLVRDKKDFLDGWPSGVDVEFIENDFEYDDDEDKKENPDDPIRKVYHFLHKFTEEQARAAKWTLKIDDDCYNDFQNMKKYINKYYDYQKEYYLVGELRHENDQIELEILKKMNLWDDYKISGWQHEFEACIVSEAAMVKIVQNKNCKELFRRRTVIGAGFTDQCMGLAADFCQIYPTLTHLILPNAAEQDLKVLATPFDDRIDPNVQVNKRLHFVHYHPIRDGDYMNLLEYVEIEEALKKIKQKYELLKK